MKSLIVSVITSVCALPKPLSLERSCSGCWSRASIPQPSSAGWEDGQKLFPYTALHSVLSVTVFALLQSQLRTISWPWMILSFCLYCKFVSLGAYKAMCIHFHSRCEASDLLLNMLSIQRLSSKWLGRDLQRPLTYDVKHLQTVERQHSSRFLASHLHDADALIPRPSNLHLHTPNGRVQTSGAEECKPLWCDILHVLGKNLHTAVLAICLFLKLIAGQAI